MANIFVISDTHFNHENILKFLRVDGARVRPFDNVKQMDDLMVQNWNETVRVQDHVYHLGDVAMKRGPEVEAILSSLNGHLRLVRGNHDIFRTKWYLQWFAEIYGVRVLSNLLFSHIPIHRESLGRFAANVHGHVHEKPSPNGPYINVSVENTHYKPMALDDLVQQAKRLKFELAI